jgi:putative GTP pyrophosphokinase
MPDGLDIDGGSRMPNSRQKSAAALPDRERLKSVFDSLRPACEKALQAQYQGIRALLEGAGYTPTIKYRLKRFDTFFEKLLRNHRRGKGRESEPVSDLLGLRIVCPFLEDVESVERILADHFEVVETERKGGNHSIREFGYDSVHLVVQLPPGLLEEVPPGSRPVCEIQLRTILQDAWAEVEHELVYKSDISLPNESVRRKLAALNATLALSDLIFQELRDYQKEIRKRGRKRRASLLEAFKNSKLGSVPPAAEHSGDDLPPPEPPLLLPGNSLEKTMLSALEAHSSNDLETAIDLYGKLLGMNLEKHIRALVYNHRGMAFFSQGDYRRAVGDFTRAIHYDGENCRSYVNRGICRRVLGKFEASVEDFGRALQIAPGHADSFFGRAQTYYEMKLHSLAFADCEKALQIQPGHRSAAYLLQCIRRDMF